MFSFIWQFEVVQLVGGTFITKRVVKTCQEGQGKAVLDVPFVVRVVLTAVL